MTAETKDTLRCSFCGKSQLQVEQLVNGPNVRICNNCVDICNEIIADNKLSADGRTGESQRPRAPQAVHVGTLTCPRCRFEFALHTEAPEDHS
jgi:ATP-dependent Clp protease ATP-binding subunit ClpX